MAIIEKPDDGKPFDNGKKREDGQYENYAVLPKPERDKGFIRPFRAKYRHLVCDSVTIMGEAIAETFARDPTYYGRNFCCSCGEHFPVGDFVWEGTDIPVGT